MTKEEIIFWVLCGTFTILFGYSLIQFTLIHTRTRSGWTIQKMFLIFMAIASVLRSIFFALVNVNLLNEENFFVPDHGDLTFNVVSNVPRLIFISTNAMLLLFWAELLHRIKNHSVSFNKKRNLFIILNVVIYAIQIISWILLFTFDHVIPTFVPYVGVSENIAFSVIFAVMAALFFFYGCSLIMFLKDFPPESTGRTSKLAEVLTCTVIGTISFLLRASFLVFTIFFTKTIDTNIYIILAFYLSVEVIPSAVILVILFRVPAELRDTIGTEPHNVKPEDLPSSSFSFGYSSISSYGSYGAVSQSDNGEEGTKSLSKTSSLINSSRSSRSRDSNTLPHEELIGFGSGEEGYSSQYYRT